jgi:hypothetical protein
MSLLGTRLTLWVGPTVPVPPPLPVMEALDRVEVSSSDSGRSGFQITFRAGRGAGDLIDDSLLTGPLLQPFSRVLMTITFSGLPEVLMDGIITNRELAPGNEPGTSTLTVTGEDVSVMLDLEEKSVEHPAQPEMVIALKIIATYAQYGLIPKVIPPTSLDVPLPTERIPTQQTTDLQYLQDMAERFAYVFYVIPGPAPLTNTAYWGPPVRVGVPQRALSVNLGPRTNVSTINFRYNGLSSTFFEGSVQDRRSHQKVPIRTFASTRIPLSRQPAGLAQRHRRIRQMRQPGLDTAQAFSRAQSQTDASTDSVLTATGELDALRYEGLLRPRGLVGLRGAGDTHDGFYYVQQVSHSISKGSYGQSFTLTREGTGAISPVVIP